MGRQAIAMPAFSKFAAAALMGAASVSGTTYFKEDFSNGMDGWVQSDWKKSGGEAGEFAISAGDYYGDAEADKGLKTTQDARFYAISKKFDKTFDTTGKTIVVQYSVKHTQKIDCGGSYLKLLPSGLDQKDFKGGAGESKYNIMFGPDVCGSTKKVHAIFNYGGSNLDHKKNVMCETDQLSHLYTFIVNNKDNTYEVQVDGVKKESGSTLEDWPILKPKKINDPAISKPTDWVDTTEIPDPEDKKPEGWDDVPAQIADPEATKPEDWDDEDDGEWEAPMIDNPEYKGEWKAKMIKNPEYKGEWEHPQIDNPEFVDEKEPTKYGSIDYVGFDLWQVKSGDIFDNIIVTDDPAEAKAFADETFFKNKDAEKAMFDKAEADKRPKEEEERKAKEAADKAKEEAEKKDDEDDEEDAADDEV